MILKQNQRMGKAVLYYWETNTSCTPVARRAIQNVQRGWHVKSMRTLRGREWLVARSIVAMPRY